MKEKIQEGIRNWVATDLTEKCFKLNISPESKSRIEYIKDMLKNRSDLSFMVYFNHICFSDPLFAGYVTNKVDPSTTRQLIAPISYSHTEMKMKNIGTLGMKLVANASGVEIYRLIQSYQVNNPDYGYTSEMANSVSRSFFNRLKKIKSEGIQLGCMISPEGHRSENGVLKKGEKGIILINKLIEPVINIPVGISFNNDFNRSGLNIGKELTLTVGNPSVCDSKSSRTSFEKLMTDLAESLPINMRGEWANKSI